MGTIYEMYNSKEEPFILYKGLFCQFSIILDQLLKSLFS